MTASNSRSSFRRYGVAVVVVVWATGFSSLLGGLRSVPHDAFNQYFPAVAFVGSALQAGNSPLWNPYVLSGYPALADPQMFLFAPSVVLPALLGFPDSIHWFILLVTAHTLVGGLGFFVLARRLGFAAVPSAMGAILFMFGGPMLIRLQHSSHVMACSYFPWALLMLLELLNRPRIWASIGFGLLAGIMAGYYNQVSYLFGLVLLCVASFSVIDTARKRLPVLPKLGWLCMSGVIALVILAPQFYGTLTFLDDSNRSGYDFSAATPTHTSLWPYNLATLVIPNLFGALEGYNITRGDRSESVLYVGALVVCVLLYFGLWQGYLWRRKNILGLGMATFAIIYMLGSATPTYRLFYEFIPGVNLYQRPIDANFVLHFAIAALFVSVFDDVLRADRGAPEIAKTYITASRLLSLIVAGGILLAIWKSWSISSDWEPTLWNTMSGVSWILVSAWLLAFRRIPGKNWNLAATALLSINLIFVNIQDGFNTVKISDLNPPLRFVGAADDLNNYIVNNTVASNTSPPPRVDFNWVSWNVNIMPNFYGIHSVSGYNPLVSSRYMAFTGVNATDPNHPHGFSAITNGYMSHAMDFLGVKYVVTTLDLADSDPEYDPMELPQVAQFANTRVYSNAGAMPRARLLKRFIGVCDRARVESLLADPEFSYRYNAILELDGDDIGELSPYVREDFGSDLVGCEDLRVEFPGDEAGDLSFVRYENDRVEIVTDAGFPRVLVLADVLAEGWKVYINGEQDRVYYANLAFRGVLLPPGRNRVDFQYRPFDRDVIESVLRRAMSGQ